MEGERFLVRATLLVATLGIGFFGMLLVGSMAPAADAFAPAVVSLSGIGPGERVEVRHGRTAYFVVHRTGDQIATVRDDDDAPMPSPEADASRVKRDEWLVVEARPENSYFYPLEYRTYKGKYGGWYAPLGNQHYDLSGRLREGYGTTRNLPVPKYYFLTENILVIE